VNTSERFLVTGAYGCIGAWTVRQLIEESVPVVALDVGADARRLELLLTDAQMRGLPTMPADITDLDVLEATLEQLSITNVIHLAALNLPTCRDNPTLGARVNVVGTVNVLEAVARRKDSMAPVVYASSIAAYGDVGGAPARVDDGEPATIYGVFKRAVESAAAVYWRDRELSSIGLRPHTVYGLGRDQGLTSAPTAAMLAAAAGRRYHIPYGGLSTLQYAPDVAAAFIAASRSAATGASVHNLPGEHVRMSELVAAIEAAAPEAAGSISWDEVELPFPSEVDTASSRAVLENLSFTPLRAATADTIARFRSLLAAGAL
jgi:UDP-glucuronate 4-epimerase